MKLSDLYDFLTTLADEDPHLYVAHQFSIQEYATKTAEIICLLDDWVAADERYGENRALTGPYYDLVDARAALLEACRGGGE